MPPPNRREQLDASTTYVGIDFVEVDPTAQVDIWVYFIGNPTAVFGPDGYVAFTSPENVVIASVSDAASLPTVAVASASWTLRNARRVLHVVTETPGDFSRYTLTLVDTVAISRVDPYFNGVAFRFQAGCRSDLDCQPAEAACPPPTEPDVPIDYTARDFGSYRRALFEFASLRWPDWTDRLEADLGVMLLEAMSAMADEMAYFQDRVARESSIRTATQRRSLRHHARLFDHEPHDGLMAWTWIRVTVGGGTVLVPRGTAVRTTTVLDPETGEQVGEQVVFEMGAGLADTLPDGAAPAPFDTRFAWNELPAWRWDEDEVCLEAGATEVWIEGTWVTGPDALWTGADKWILLQTNPTDPAVPARALVVRLVGGEEVYDPLLATTVTKLRWDPADATPWAVDLATLVIAGNIVPAVAGRTVPAAGEELLFRVRDPAAADIATGWTFAPPGAIERTGPNGTVAYLLPLAETEEDALAWKGEAPTASVPEIVVEALSSEGDPSPTRWRWRRSMTGSPSALPTDLVYTLEDGLWAPVARFWRGGAEPVTHTDYRTGAGFTVRFGDGALGQVPDLETVFRVTYRVGGGAADNVAAHTLVETPLAGIVVTNPLPVSSGVDAETAEEIRQVAPEAWKALAYRAVREEDYAEALERLSWVQRGGARLRWTGSWLTLFGTPDPTDAVTLTASQRGSAEAQLDRFRQAGREAHLMDPVYAWLDLRITVCVDPACYRGEVQARVNTALFAPGGFFDPDHFTFGDPLRRSALYAAIQAVPGVRAVERIQVRRRGHFGWRDLAEEALAVGNNEVIGLANDPRWPERGAVAYTMEGGA